MNKQKLISVLQSRIAKQKTYITLTWIDYQLTSHEGDKKLFKEYAIKLGVEQKYDKQILKQLVEDARHKQHYVEVVYDMNKELQVLRRELASYKITGLPYALHHLRGGL